MEKKREQLEDGRYIVFYAFDDEYGDESAAEPAEEDPKP